MPEYFNGFQINLDNYPLPLPGIYRYTNLISGKTYIGMSKNIEQREHDEKSSAPVFRKAIIKYGRDNFLLEPLFYWTEGTVNRKWLYQLEAQLIADNNSVKHGYNIKEADGGSGPYGPEFSKILRNYWENLTEEELKEIGRKVSIGLLANTTKEQRIEISRIAGKAAVAARTYEEWVEMSKKGGAIGHMFVDPEVRLASMAKARRVYIETTTEEARLENFRAAGRASAATKTPAERSALGKKASDAFLAKSTHEERSARMKIYGGFVTMSRARHSENAKKGWITRRRNLEEKK
jgi:group I intron endonuclease